MSEYTAMEKFSELMIKDILGKLEGSHKESERLEVDLPSKLIVLGTLGDRSKNYSSSDDSVITSVNKARTISSVKNNSMTVKFLIHTGTEEEIKVVPSFSLYYRVYPTYAEQKKHVEGYYGNHLPEKVELTKIWKRIDLINYPEVVFSKGKNKVELDFSSAKSKILEDENLLISGSKINSAFLEDEKSYLSEIKRLKKRTGQLPEWKATIEYKKEDFKGCKMISVSFVNNSDELKGVETFLFNCNLKIDVSKHSLCPFKYEYSYDATKHSIENFTRTLNCHADYNKNEGVIKTKHYYIFEQKKLVPKVSIDSVRFNFENLETKKGIEELRKLEALIEERVMSWKQDPRYSEKEYKKNVDHMEGLNKRFREGIEVLESVAEAKKAFQLLNKTFHKASRYDGWRGFQIFFIVSLIPDIVDKTKRRDITEIIHVGTGGGKSEAYFGIVVFAAFYDRLTGKKYGITAITKFPLRMLSVQQLQRIANIIIWAEKIRKEERIAGHDFSVSYFVGSSKEFPRHTKPIIDEIKKERDKGHFIPGTIIDKCPFCDGDVVLDFKEKERYIIHKCTNCGEEFKLFFTDEETYRFLPTFMVCTVDKLAGVSSNRRFRNLLGGSLDECPDGHGFIPGGDICEVETDSGLCKKNGTHVSRSFSTAPTLVIQDEMHLIRAEFGTIDSHFESLLETLQEELTENRVKNICMTATMTGAKEQIKNLYGKEINVFPGHSPNGKGSEDDIFFKLERIGDRELNQRYLVGLKPNMRDNQYASLLTLRYLAEFIGAVENSIEDYKNELGVSEQELSDILKKYKNLLTYHNKKSDVYSMKYYLNAVANSKLKTNKIAATTLTGNNELHEIKKLIEYIINRDDRAFFATFSTSVVSHGVDIDKWNFMIFQGIPRTTSEYIQALSRVGRKYPGIVFVWFYPNRARDLSFYQNFFEYHSIIEHKVEPVPLSRWAELGFKQTFTSIFNAAILTYFSEKLERPIYRVEDVKDVFSDTDNRKQLMDFLKKSYLSFVPVPGAEFFRERINDEVERRLNYLEKYTGSKVSFFPNALKDSAIQEFKTQYGMRGIQDSTHIVPISGDIEVLKKISR